MLSPIYSIPTETLSHIFRALVDDKDETLEHPLRREKLPLALSVRSVCRRWRTLAENTPEIWPDIVGPHGLEWTRRALSWSKNCSLDIYLRANARHRHHVKDWDESLPAILSQIHRARTLHVTFHNTSTAPQLVQQALLSSSLPRLEDLYIDGTFVDVQLLDTQSFAGEVPHRLRNLDLTSCTLPTTCLVFKASLTSLSIHDCSIWSSVGVLVDTLSRFPALEDFSLVVYSWTAGFDPLPLAASTASDDWSPVSLPALQSIRLRTQIEYASYLFTYLSFPASCSVVVDADLDNVALEDLPDLYPVLDRAFGKRLHAAFPEDDQNTGFRTLALDIFQEDTADGVTVKLEQPTAGSGGPELFHLAFLLGPQFPEIRQFDALSAITHYMLESWPATRRAATHLNVSHPTLFDTDYAPLNAAMSPWEQALTLFDSVENLALSYASLYVMDALLVEGLSPHLRHIDMEGARLTSKDYEDLVRALTARIAPSQTLASTLKLKDFTLDGDDMGTMTTILKRGARGIQRHTDIAVS